MASTEYAHPRAVRISRRMKLRIATIDVPGEPPVAIWYLHVYATDDVDLIAVTNR